VGPVQQLSCPAGRLAASCSALLHHMCYSSCWARMMHSLNNAAKHSQSSMSTLNHRGVLVVASAGNDALSTDTQPHVPSTLPNPNLLSVSPARADYDALCTCGLAGSALMMKSCTRMTVLAVAAIGRSSRSDWRAVGKQQLRSQDCGPRCTRCQWLGSTCPMPASENCKYSQAELQPGSRRGWGARPSHWRRVHRGEPPLPAYLVTTCHSYGADAVSRPYKAP